MLPEDFCAHLPSLPFSIGHSESVSKGASVGQHSHCGKYWNKAFAGSFEYMPRIFKHYIMSSDGRTAVAAAMSLWWLTKVPNLVTINKTASPLSTTFISSNWPWGRNQCFQRLRSNLERDSVEGFCWKMGRRLVMEESRSEWISYGRVWRDDAASPTTCRFLVQN